MLLPYPSEGLIMVEDHGAPEAGQLSRASIRDWREKRVAKEQAAQNEMRGVLSRMTAGAA